MGKIARRRDVEAGSLDQGGSFDGTSRKVKWGPFFDPQARVFTVVLEPGSNPIGANLNTSFTMW